MTDENGMPETRIIVPYEFLRARFSRGPDLQGVVDEAFKRLCQFAFDQAIKDLETSFPVQILEGYLATAGSKSPQAEFADWYSRRVFRLVAQDQQQTRIAFWTRCLQAELVAWQYFNSVQVASDPVQIYDEIIARTVITVMGDDENEGNSKFRPSLIWHAVLGYLLRLLELYLPQAANELIDRFGAIGPLRESGAYGYILCAGWFLAQGSVHLSLKTRRKLEQKLEVLASKVDNTSWRIDENFLGCGRMSEVSLTTVVIPAPTSARGSSPVESRVRYGEGEQSGKHPQYLREALTKRFSLTELRNLAFDLGIDYEILDNNHNKADLARELLSYFIRRDRIPILVNRMVRDRLDIKEWFIQCGIWQE